MGEQILIPLLWFQMSKVAVGGNKPFQVSPNGMICRAKNASETCKRVLFIYNKFDRAWRCECSPKAKPEDLVARGIEDFVLFAE